MKARRGDHNHRRAKYRYGILLLYRRPNVFFQSFSAPLWRDMQLLSSFNTFLPLQSTLLTLFTLCRLPRLSSEWPCSTSSPTLSLPRRPLLPTCPHVLL
jgi:hypothetical protein